MIKESLVLFALLGLTSAAYSAPLLKPQRRIVLSGPAEHFDYMAVDEVMNRLLAAHTGAGTLVVVNLKSDRVFPAIQVGAAQGVAVDRSGGHYFVGDSKDHKVVIVSSRTLKVTGQVKTPGPVDAISFDPKAKQLYADEDDGDRVWVVHPRTKTIQATIGLPGVPEYVEFDPNTNRIYQNIKSKDEVVKINPISHRIEAIWSTLPAKSPHGLAVDRKRGWVISAGGNGKLVAIRIKDGKVFSSAPIALHVDQISYDGDKGLIYCACRGKISIVKVTDQGLRFVGSVSSPKGAHTLTVDPSTHAVWISYWDQKKSYLEKFDAVP